MKFVFGICRCYVWPLPYSGGIVETGRCKRCGEKAKPLSIVIGWQEALEIYKEEYGTYPRPIGDEPWWELPYWQARRVVR